MRHFTDGVFIRTLIIMTLPDRLAPKPDSFYHYLYHQYYHAHINIIVSVTSLTCVRALVVDHTLARQPVPTRPACFLYERERRGRQRQRGERRGSSERERDREKEREGAVRERRGHMRGGEGTKTYRICRPS